MALHTVSDLTSCNMPGAPLKLRPYFAADFDADADFGWLEELERLVPRKRALNELKSIDAWDFLHRCGDYDLRRRVEAGIFQARLIIVDPTVRALGMKEEFALGGDRKEEEIARRWVLEDLLRFDTPLWGLNTKGILLVDGVSIETNHIGNMMSPSESLDPYRLLMQVGQRKNNRSNGTLSETNVLRFAYQVTSTCIDVDHPEVWHEEYPPQTEVWRPACVRQNTIDHYCLLKSCGRGKWFDDDLPDALFQVQKAVAEDTNYVLKLQRPWERPVATQLGKFDDYAAISMKDGPWRFASDIAAGFARLWYERECPERDPVQKAKWLRSKYRYVIYNGTLLL